MNKQTTIDQQTIPDIIVGHVNELMGKDLHLQKMFGTTNATYKVWAKDTRTLIFRVLSPIIDRDYENAVLKQLEKHGICPQVIYCCGQYRIEEFIENVEHPVVEEINEQVELQKNIILKLHQMHQVKLPSEYHRSFFDDVLFTPTTHARYQTQKCQETGKQHKFRYLKQRLLREFDTIHTQIHAHFKGKKSGLVLSHNDANSRNIFVKKTDETEDTEILLIDFEYACYNYASYDIANFLNECCFDYGEFEHGFRVFKTVTMEDISRACRMYPSAYHGMEKDVYFMLIICNYAWGLWSLQLPGNGPFSPLQHGIARFQLFEKYKHSYSKYQGMGAL